MDLMQLMTARVLLAEDLKSRGGFMDWGWVRVGFDCKRVRKERETCQYLIKCIYKVNMHDISGDDFA